MITQHYRMLKPMIYYEKLRDRTETETTKPVQQCRDAITRPTNKQEPETTKEQPTPTQELNRPY